MNDFMRITNNVRNINDISFWGAKPASAETAYSSKLLEEQLKLKPDMNENDYLEIIDRWVRREKDPNKKKALINEMKNIICRHFNDERTSQARLQLKEAELSSEKFKKVLDKLSYPHTPSEELENIVSGIDFDFFMANTYPEEYRGELKQCYTELKAVINEAKERCKPFFFRKGKTVEQSIKSAVSGEDSDIKTIFTNKFNEFLSIITRLIPTYPPRISTYSTAYNMLESYIAKK